MIAAQQDGGRLLAVKSNQNASLWVAVMYDCSSVDNK